MNEREEILNNYYKDYDEEGRLLSKHGRVEFLTTVNYVEKYLKENDSVLEVEQVLVDILCILHKKDIK